MFYLKPFTFQITTEGSLHNHVVAFTNMGLNYNNKKGVTLKVFVLVLHVLIVGMCIL